MIKKVIAKKNTTKKTQAKLKLGDDGYEVQFVGIVTEAIMDVVNRKMDDINRGLHVVLEKKLDDFRIYGDGISGINDQLKIMNERLGNIEGDVSILKQDVNTLKDDVSILKDDVHYLKGDVGQIKTYIFDNVEPRMHVLEIRDKEMA